MTPRTLEPMGAAALPERAPGVLSRVRVELASKLIPFEADHVELVTGEGDTLALTDLHEVLWPDRGSTKGDLLRYYTMIAPVLLPHIRDRAMVMKRHPRGESGAFGSMKLTPEARPRFVRICRVEHTPGDVIDCVLGQDLASLLWLINLGCIDLSPWYARCDDDNRPDYLNFDLDPTEGAIFAQVLEAGLVVREALADLGMPSYVKTSGARGLHIYVPLARGPIQKEVWTLAKALANILALRRPALLTAERRMSERPKRRVLIDYTQNAWARPLVSAYSVRPTRAATVSTPVTWSEVEHGLSMDDHRMETVPARIERLGDVWAPLLDPDQRVRLDEIV